MQWPWLGKSYTVTCPDGTKRTIYRDVDDAFPLYIPGWKGGFKAEGGASADALGIEGLRGKVEGEYATRIDGLLFSINELNQSYMMSFRTVYLTFLSDPCGNSGFLQRQVEKIVADQQRITQLGIQVRFLIELVRSQPQDTAQIVKLFKEIAGKVGGPPLAEAAATEISEARQIADQWSENDGS